MKQHYLDTYKSAATSTARQLDGKIWYNQEASRSVNQSIGRVIRHIGDFGVILLVDERYSWGNNQKDLPSWVRKTLQKLPRPQMLGEVLSGFWKVNEHLAKHVV